MHLAGLDSYIPDRTLDALAEGHPMVTNNPAVARFFGVALATPRQMCAVQPTVPTAAVIADIFANHTYESRFAHLVHMLQ